MTLRHAHLHGKTSRGRENKNGRGRMGGLHRVKKEEEKERSMANAKGIVPAHAGRCSMLTQPVCQPVKEERRGKLDDEGTDEISHHQRPAHKTSTDTKQPAS